jgi:hypothetical protein
LMYRSVGAALFVTLLVVVVLGAFMLGLKPESQAARYVDEWLFRGLVPYQVIHNMGIGIFALTTLTILFGVGSFVRNVWRGVGKHSFGEWRAAARTTAAEIALMKRHNEETPAGPVWLRPSVVHKAIMYGFMGLLLATVLDFAFIVLLPLGTTFWPARIIGIVSGVAMMIGVIAAGVRRFKKVEKNVERSSFADWWLLFYLFVLGATGFWLLGAVSFRAAGAFNDFVLLVHAAMAMELVLLMAFTKMAHVMYRPLALFAHYLRSGKPGVQTQED